MNVNNGNGAVPQVPVTLTHFERATVAQGTRCQLTWPELVTWCQRPDLRAPSKSGLPLIKLATFAGDYRSDATLEAIYGIEGDYDGGTVQPAIAAAMLAEARICGLILTTPSHRPDAPRWRVFCPTSRPLQPAEHHGLVSRLQGALRGILAPESFVASQAYYVGAVDGCEPVQAFSINGAPIDTVEGIAPIGPPSSTGARQPLGTLPTVAREHVEAALGEIDPGQLDYPGWRDVTAAYRGAGGQREPWDRWCAGFAANDLADNDKLWRSLDKGTALGWSYLARHAPQAAAAAAFGSGDSAPVFGEMLTPDEQRAYFASCTLIGPRNVIVDGKGIEYGPGAFNAAMGGKRFIISSDGKTTDEPWKAATRSTVWTVPKVDGYAFRTDLPTGDVATDELGRSAVNVYVPARIDRTEGDPAPFLDHLARVIPDEADRRVLLDYLAHNVRFPGFKIPWAPLIQSAEGVGKNALKHVMNHAIGNHYTYAPNAKELGSSGSKFNAWMERKLFLIADEIKTDDRRDLIEILKPMITEESLEIQGKGVDQRKAENPANWLFFSNHKDAIPVGKNDRRFAIFYSAIQSKADLDSAGMDGAYFARLYDEFLGNRSHRRGLKIMADYLLRYPIERGAVPMRAPVTSSTLEAVEVGRGWLEQLIAEAVDNQANGFRAGWINTAAVGRVLRENGRKAGPHPIGNAIAALGFHRIGQAGRGWWNDEPQDASKRGYLYHREPSADPADYGRAQGYE
jgi:hypothetical protein|tara:strand:+ start:246 stop:2465 length:2220 start_codon:yes stop_codon:yes gene_type:complete